MEREQILKVMVPVGAFGLLLVVVGVVIALNSGGSVPNTSAAAHSGDPQASTANPPEGRGGPAVLGSVPLDDSGMTHELPSLTAPEWKDSGRPEVPGLKIWDVKEGTEDITVGVTDGLKLHYIGWRTDGISFDSSAKHGGPSEFGLSGVIQGWTYGIPGMKVGGIRRLYIPARFAYGSQNKPGIPPNSDLVFEVKLLRVMRQK